MGIMVVTVLLSAGVSVPGKAGRKPVTLVAGYLTAR